MSGGREARIGDCCCLEVRDVGKETIVVVVKKEKKKPILCNRLENLSVHASEQVRCSIENGELPLLQLLVR